MATNPNSNLFKSFQTESEVKLLTFFSTFFVAPKCYLSVCVNVFFSAIYGVNVDMLPLLVLLFCFLLLLLRRTPCKKLRLVGTESVICMCHLGGATLFKCSVRNDEHLHCPTFCVDSCTDHISVSSPIFAISNSNSPPFFLITFQDETQKQKEEVS